MSRPMFDTDRTHFASLSQLCPVVEGAIVSKPLLHTAELRQVLFAVDRDQQISEHRAPFVATVHVLQGRMTFTASGRSREMAAGDWVVMPADEPHALAAIEPTTFLLTMARSASSTPDAPAASPR